MIEQGKLLDKKWQIYWIDGDKGRTQVLAKIFHPKGFAVSVEAGNSAVQLIEKYDFGKECSLDLSAAMMTVFLNLHGEGPLAERFYSLASDIEDRLSDLS